MGAEAEGVMEGLTNETMGINGTTTENDFCTQDREHDGDPEWGNRSIPMSWDG